LTHGLEFNKAAMFNAQPGQPSVNNPEEQLKPSTSKVTAIDAKSEEEDLTENETKDIQEFLEDKEYETLEQLDDPAEIQWLFNYI